MSEVYSKIRHYTVNVAAVLTAGGFFAMHSSIAEAATSQGTSKATVTAGLTLNQTSELNFGSFFVEASAGTVIVDATGNANATGGVTMLPGITPQNGVFSITGQAGRALQVTIDSSATLSNGTQTMALTLTPGTLPSTLSASGVANVNVGGSLAVAANQGTGTYTGSYNVTVIYQ